MSWSAKNTNRKTCIECGNLVLKLKGYGMGDRCYNFQYAKYSQEKQKGNTNLTFANWMREKRGLSISVMQDIPKGKKSKSKKPRTEKQKWTTKLDSVFSVFIRLRDTGAEGYGQSIDGYGIIWYFVNPEGDIETNCDNGHFEGRANGFGRFNEINCNAQKQFSNRYKEGDKVAYRIGLCKKRGEVIVETLERNCKLFNKQKTALEMQDLYTHYEKEVTRLLKTKTWWDNQRTQKSLYK